MINSLEVTIWGRVFVLPIVYDCLSDGIITEFQKKAIDNFAAHLEWVDQSKRIVEDYCKEEVNDDDSNKKKDNIFSYIKPEQLYVKRLGQQPEVALMCKYRYDLENGLTVVFDHEGNVSVGPQDMIL